MDFWILLIPLPKRKPMQNPLLEAEVSAFYFESISSMLLMNSAILWIVPSILLKFTLKVTWNAFLPSSTSYPPILGKNTAVLFSWCHQDWAFLSRLYRLGLLDELMWTQNYECHSTKDMDIKAALISNVHTH